MTALAVQETTPAPAARRTTRAEAKRAAITRREYVPAPDGDEKFFIPTPPAYLATLGPSPHLAYLRKSSEDAAKQTLSITAQRQHNEQAAKRALPLTWWEAFSGTTFDQRPAFQALLAFCRANPQPAHAPGTIWAWDYDRFSRQQILIDGHKKPHTKAMLKMLLEFDEVGWRWHFVKTPPMGYELGDMIIGLVKFEQSGQYSSGLSENVQRNKDLRALDPEVGGLWMGGTPPYPAMRQDAVTGRVLQPTEWVQSEHGVVLVRNEDWYPYWEVAARKVLEGWTPQRVADHLNSIGAPLGPTMVAWTRKSVLRMLTNTALVGWPVYQRHRGKGTTYRARWEPLVDVALFEAVQAKLSSRARGTVRRNALRVRPLDITCPFCDATYQQTVKPDGRRYYVHPSPRHAPKGEGWRQLALESGCKAFAVPAEQLEWEILQLIQQERGTADFAACMDREQQLEQAHQTQLHTDASRAQRAYEQEQQEYLQLQTNLMRLTNPDLVRELEVALLKKRTAVEQAKATWQAMVTGSSAGQNAEALDERIRQAKEINLLVEAFNTALLERRRAVFDYWLGEVALKATPIQGARKGPRKSQRYVKQVAVALRWTPEDFRFLTITPEFGAQMMEAGQTYRSLGKWQDLSRSRHSLPEVEQGDLPTQVDQPQRPVAGVDPFQTFGEIGSAHPRRLLHPDSKVGVPPRTLFALVLPSAYGHAA